MAAAYLNGGMSRRTFIRRLSTLGVSAGAAITYAYALRPETAAAAAGVCAVYAGQQAPVITTGTATAVTAAGATLNATVNANLLVTLCYFEFGPTPAYGDATRVVDGGSASTAGPIAATVTGLAPGTTYHYRAVAQNGSGRTLGLDATFVTPASPPDTTPPALGVEVLFTSRASMLGGRRLGLVVTATEAMTGNLSATVLVPGRRRSKGRPATPARRVTVGTAAFSLPSAGAQKVVLTLSGLGVVELRGLKAPTLTISAEGSDAAGNAATASAIARF